jgi:hypothetical protein
VWVTNTETVHLLPSSPASRVPASASPTTGHRHPHDGIHLPVYHPPTRTVDTSSLALASYIVLGAVALALLAFLVSAFVRRDRRPPRDRQPKPAEFIGARMDALDVPPDLVETAERQLVALREGSPRNAIVACWLELDRACREGGLPRGRAETSTEFTARVLSRYTVGAQTVTTLAGLYREARFSEHHLTEADRDQARSALEEILASLQQAHLQKPRLENPTTVASG